MENERNSVLTAALGSVLSIVLSNGSPDIWYVAVSFVLILILLPHWHERSNTQSATITYAAVFALSTLPGLSWLLDLIIQYIPFIKESISFIKLDSDGYLFGIWIFLSGGIYYARKA